MEPYFFLQTFVDGDETPQPPTLLTLLNYSEEHLYASGGNFSACPDLSGNPEYSGRISRNELNGEVF